MRIRILIVSMILLLFCNTGNSATISQDTGTHVSYLSSENYRRLGERINSFPISTITSITFYLKKEGSPTGTAYVRVRKVSDDSILGTLGSIDVSTLTGSYVAKTFNSALVANGVVQDIRVLLEYSGGNAANNISMYDVTPSAYAGGNTSGYTTSYTDYAAYDTRWVNLTYYEPTVSSLTLSQYGSSLNRGQYLCTPDYITISGSCLQDATAVSFGDGITVTDFDVDSVSQVTINKMYISKTAATGARTCTVTSPYFGSIQKASALSVTDNEYYPLTGSGWGWVYNTLSSNAAWRFHGTYDRTYIVYQGPKSTTNNGDTYITYYDHDQAAAGNNPWGDHVKVATTPGTALAYDTVPSVCVSQDGYILVGYGGKNVTQQVYLARSTNVEDISAWGAGASMGVGYYQDFIVADNGDIYYIYQRVDTTPTPNNLRYYSYRKSTDEGVNFAAYVDFINFSDDGTGDDQVYGTWRYNSVDDKIYGVICQWDNVGEADTRSHDLWCILINTADGKIQDAAGGYDSTTALTHANAMSGSYKFLVKDTTTDEGTYNPTLNIDSNGTIHIVCPIWDLSDEEAHIYTQSYQMYTYWTGSAWATPQNIAYVHPMSQPSLEIISPTNMVVYCPDLNRDMARYQYYNSTWTKIEKLFDISSDVDNADSVAACPFVPELRSPGLPLVFTEVDYTDYTRRRRAYVFIRSTLVGSKVNGVDWANINTINTSETPFVKIFH